MVNEKLRKRITKIIAMSYAMTEEDVHRAYEKLGSIEKLLTLLETGRLQQVLAEIK